VTGAHVFRRAPPSKMNKDFVAAFEKANNYRPNFVAVAVAAMTACICSTRRSRRPTGDADGDKLIGAMKGMAWESPRGPISNRRPRPATSSRTSMSRKVEKVDGKLYNVEFANLRERQGSGEGGERRSS